MNLYNLLKALHVISVVFMAAPLYNLIVVNKRVRFGKAALGVRPVLREHHQGKRHAVLHLFN